ncbi:hypothetical protein F5Y15DRAFT_408041 [Xylariaceae sp. FL0016]|nr:hypothetical protein F5Y15DRAFT_408041 [Xylariaceae sp. FL0016]
MQSTGHDDEEPSEQAGADAKPSATLYCPKTNLMHVSLVDYGIIWCPACSQNLSKQPNFSKQLELESPSESGDDGVSDDKENQCAENITYSIEYHDSGDYFIGTTSSPGPFVLSEAKKAARGANDLVMNVITVIQTSHPPDQHRWKGDAQKIMRDGILDNPRIGVRVSSTSLEISSAHCIKALKSLVTYYPDTNLWTIEDFLKIEEPFAVIGHYLEEIRHSDPPSPVQTKPGRVTYKHLGILLDFVLNPVFIERLQQEKPRHDQSPPRCTYRMLWLLYKPGETVYAESDGMLSAFVVQSVKMDPAILSGRMDALKPYKIKLWSLDFDGHYVRRRKKKVTIPAFDGERDITSLVVVPCNFRDREDSGVTRTRLIDEGKKWFSLLRGGQVLYKGRTMDSKKQLLEGRVFIDPQSYIVYRESLYEDDDFTIKDYRDNLVDCPCEKCHGCRPHPPNGFPYMLYDVIDPKSEDSLQLNDEPRMTDHRYLLCSRRLYGFSLKLRSWECLNVAHCYPTIRNPRSIEYLVMGDERKRMIKALVHKFAGSPAGRDGPPTPWGADFVDGKGEGKIFLLHGGPGVGKTYNIECIADFTGRPLLSLTCGDLGSSEEKMEEHLTKWFRLAEKWGAVMLLDEADVYLEKRQTADIHRNSLVSVFLRCMKYYKGILFLTTNRVGTFDDAFISRIQVVIHYKDLGEIERRKIWEQFFDKLTRERKDITVPRKTRRYVLDTSDMKKLEWNGREIRNAFQTAVSLAEYRFSTEMSEDEDKPDKVELEIDDFDQVCEMTVDFKQYLDGVHGADEKERAFKERARADL